MTSERERELSTHDVGEQRCPECAEALPAATNADGSQGAPEPGNASVCWYCGAILVFDSELRLRVATLTDRGDMPPAVFRLAKFIVYRRGGRLS